MKKILLLDFKNGNNEISIQYYNEEEKFENIKEVVVNKDILKSK